MKCPYTVNSDQYTEHVYTYNDDGTLASETCRLIEKRPYVECIKEECAAWGNGCKYRGMAGG